MSSRQEIALEVAEERRQAEAEAHGWAVCPYCGAVEPDELCASGRCDDPRIP